MNGSKKKLPVIYLAFANIQGANPLPLLEKERRQLKGLMQPLSRDGHYELVYESTATRTNLIEDIASFQKRLAIFHYAGHAGSENLFLNDGKVEIDELAKLLHTQPNLKLVFLNGCATRNQVKWLHDIGVPAVIATNRSINDDSAYEFAEVFYHALVNKYTLKDSFEMATFKLRGVLQKPDIFRGIITENSIEEIIPWGLYLSDDNNEEILSISLTSLKFLDKARDYRKNLISLFEQELNGFRLSDYFIEPDYKVYRGCFLSGINKSENYISVGVPSIVEFIKTYFLYEVIDNEDDLNLKPSRVLLILGYPGQGKTSLCYKLLNDILKDRNLKGKEVVYFRLSNISEYRVGAFFENPVKYLQEEFSQYDFDFKNTVVFLDGLSEVKGVTDTQKDFRIFLRNINLNLNTKKDIFFVITSRFQCIDLNSIAKHVVVVRLEPFLWDQKINWLKKRGDDSLAKELESNVDTDNRVSWNCLNYILGIPENLVFLTQLFESSSWIDENRNRRHLCEAIFSCFFEKRIIDFDEDAESCDEVNEFNEFVQTVAWETHCSSTEVISPKMLDGLDFPNRIKKKYFKGLNDSEIFQRIYSSFFFKQAGEGDKLEFEFSFKYLHDFFVAEFVFREISNVETEKNGTLLKCVWKHFVQYPLSNETLNFLIEIIKSHSKTDKQLIEICKKTIQFLPELLQHQFLSYYNAEKYKGYPVSNILSGFQSFWKFMKITYDYVIGENLVIKPSPFDLLKMSAEERDQHILLLDSRAIKDFVLILRVLNIRHLDLSKLNLSGTDFSEINLKEASFYETILEGSNFSGAILLNSDFSKANLNRAIFIGADLRGARFIALETASLTKMNNANLERANLSNSVFTNSSDFSGASLKSANLTGTIFQSVVLKNVDFSGCVFDEETSFEDSEIEEVILSNIGSISSRGLAQKLTKAKSLKKINLSKADFRGVAFSNMELIEIDFSSAELSGTSFENSILLDVNFEGANLCGVNFIDANLTGAIFTKSKFDKEISFDSAILEGADFADIEGISDHDFAENLSKAKNLEKIRAPGIQFVGFSNLRDRKDLIGVDFSNCNFEKTNLEGVDFDGANLEGATFVEATFNCKTKLSNANLCRASFVEIQGVTEEELLVILLDTKTLYEAKGIPVGIINEIKKTNPELFINPIELNLLEIIDRGVPESIQSKYEKLLKKHSEGELLEEEKMRWHELKKEINSINSRRKDALNELSNIRGISIDDLIKDLVIIDNFDNI